MSFKLRGFPEITGVQEIDSDNVYDFLQDLFNRYGRTDISPHIITDLPPWDMQSTPEITISFPSLNVKSINDVSLVIFSDDGLEEDIASFGTGISRVYKDIPNNTLIIERLTGGIFDSATYQNSTESRGRIGLWT